MPWVVFLGNFDFSLTAKCMRAYRSGRVVLVMQRCADAAIAAGKARLATETEANASRRAQKGNRVLCPGREQR